MSSRQSTEEESAMKEKIANLEDVRDTTYFEAKESLSLSPLPKDPTRKNLKVLLVYPNYSMVNLLPTNIGILTACLRQNGFIVDLFDTTFYRTSEKTLDEIRVENLQVRKFNLGEFGVSFKPGNLAIKSASILELTCVVIMSKSVWGSLPAVAGKSKKKSS